MSKTELSLRSWQERALGNHRWRSGLAVAVLVVATVCRLWPAVETTPFHRDEARWIGNSAILREWRHPLGDQWQDEGYRNVYGTIDEVNRRRSQPPMAMYVFGIGLIVQGHGLPNTGYWIMSEGTEWNSDHGNMPSAGELTAARRTNVVIALLTVLGLYVVAQHLLNRVAGLVAGLAYALHPLVLDTSTRAWSDPLLVLFIVAAAVTAIRFGARPSIRRAALIGILLGLGAATKLSPLLLAAGIGVLGLPLLAWGVIRSRTTTVRSGWAMASIPVAALMTFVAVYPYLWTDPIGHTKRMFDFRTLSFDLQARSSPHAEVTGLGDATRRFGIQLADRDSVGGLLLESLDPRVGISDLAWLRDLDLVLASFGWILLVAVLVRHRFDARKLLPMLVLGGQVGLIALTFRLDYARYMLPLIPAIAVGIGAVAGIGWEAGSRFVVGASTVRIGAVESSDRAPDIGPLPEESHAAHSIY